MGKILAKFTNIIPLQYFSMCSIPVGSVTNIIMYMFIDIKPSNILVNTLGHVKLCDFGVSVQVSCCVHMGSQGCLIVH